MMRGWMLILRQDKWLSIRDAAIQSKCSKELLEGLEDGSIALTTPLCAKDIGAVYGMSQAQIDSISCRPIVMPKGVRQIAYGRMVGEKTPDRKAEKVYVCKQEMNYLARIFGVGASSPTAESRTNRSRSKANHTNGETWLW